MLSELLSCLCEIISTHPISGDAKIEIKRGIRKKNDSNECLLKICHYEKVLNTLHHQISITSCSRHDPNFMMGKRSNRDQYFTQGYRVHSQESNSGLVDSKDQSLKGEQHIPIKRLKSRQKTDMYFKTHKSNEGCKAMK